MGVSSILSRCLSITTDTEQSLASCSAILSRCVNSRVTTSLYISHWILKINRKGYLYTSCTPLFGLQKIQQSSAHLWNIAKRVCKHARIIASSCSCLHAYGEITWQLSKENVLKDKKKKKTKGTITRKQMTVIELCETFNFAFVVKRTMSSSVPATLPSLFSGLW